jgi:enoyl-CoA hydratase/carnithine racemase
VVVVTGAGRAFCVGANLREWADGYVGNPDEYWKWFGAFKDMHDRLREIGKPTLARINGIAVGGGNELQMACDLAVMVDDAFIRHVGPEHGSVPAGRRDAVADDHGRRPAAPRDRAHVRGDPGDARPRSGAS